VGQEIDAWGKCYKKKKTYSIFHPTYGEREDGHGEKTSKKGDEASSQTFEDKGTSRKYGGVGDWQNILEHCGKPNPQGLEIDEAK